MECRGNINIFGISWKITMIGFTIRLTPCSGTKGFKPSASAAHKSERRGDSFVVVTWQFYGFLAIFSFRAEYIADIPGVIWLYIPSEGFDKSILFCWRSSWYFLKRHVQVSRWVPTKSETLKKTAATGYSPNKQFIGLAGLLVLLGSTTSCFPALPTCLTLGSFLFTGHPMEVKWNRSVS